jgi:tubulin polyglutamylase TTLL6/13
VNHSPSFGVDTPLDLAIKGDLISDAIELVRIDPKLVRRVEAERKLASQSRLMAHK